MKKVDDTGAEICLNLWYFPDQQGIVLRIAAKAYALKGSDQEKLAVLKSLSGTDHLTATWDGVPKNQVIDQDDRRMEGATHAYAVPMMVTSLFGDLINKVEKQLPVVLRECDGDYVKNIQKIPQEPLTVITAVHETPDGRLVANVKD